jgi:hypothetical protein
MSDFIVSDAGWELSNGNYTANGTYGGKTAYEKDGGGSWIFWIAAWLIQENLGSTPPRYYGTGADLPANPWTDAAAPAPAPTVTSAGASSAIKTINGLAKASVKTVNGLAIASVKTWNTNA